MKTCCRSFCSHQDVQKGFAVIFGLIIGTYLGILSMSQPLFLRTWTHYFRLPGVGHRGAEISTVTRPHPLFRSPDTFTAASAQKLFNSTRLTCFVDESKTDHVKQSWGSRCNNFHNLYINATKSKLLSASRNVLQTLIASFGNKTDWFVKADAETFLMPENVRHLLLNESTIHPIVYKIPKKNMLWGSIFLFNRAAADKMTIFCRPPKLLRNKWDMMSCLRSGNITIRDLKDDKGRDVVIPRSPRYWFGNLKLIVKKVKKNQSLKPPHVSDYPIAFQNTDSKQILFTYLFVYRIRPAGLENEERKRGDKRKLSINVPLKLKVKFEIITRTSKPPTSTQATTSLAGTSNAAMIKPSPKQTATHAPSISVSPSSEATIERSTTPYIATTSSGIASTNATTNEPKRQLSFSFQPGDKGSTQSPAVVTSLDYASKKAATGASNSVASTPFHTKNGGSAISSVDVTSPAIVSPNLATSVSKRQVFTPLQPKHKVSTQSSVVVTSLDYASKKATTSAPNSLASTPFQRNRGSAVSYVAATSPTIGPTELTTSVSKRQVFTPLQPQHKGSTQSPVAITSPDKHQISSSSAIQESKTPTSSFVPTRRSFNNSTLQPTVPRSYGIF